MQKNLFNWSVQQHPPMRFIISLLNSFVDKKIPKQTFLDPFLGNGSIFLEIKGINDYFLGDACPAIINFFEIVQQNFSYLQENCKQYFKDQLNNPSSFTELLNKYNSLESMQCASLFLYLLHSSEEKNLTISKEGKIKGKYIKKEKLIFPQRIFNKLGKKILNNEVMFFPGDFRRIVENARFGDILYCCPPSNYRNGNSFSSNDEKDLAVLCDKAALRGAKIVAVVENNKKNHKLYEKCSWIETLENLNLPNKMVVVYNY